MTACRELHELAWKLLELTNPLIEQDEREIGITRKSLELALMRHSGRDNRHTGGWVIEGAWSPTSDPQYWAFSSLFVGDHMKATRFARKEDASIVAGNMLCGINTRICYHEWDDEIQVHHHPDNDQNHPAVKAVIEAVKGRMRRGEI